MLPVPFFVLPDSCVRRRQAWYAIQESFWQEGVGYEVR